MHLVAVIITGSGYCSLMCCCKFVKNDVFTVFPLPVVIVTILINVSILSLVVFYTYPVLCLLGKCFF